MASIAEVTSGTQSATLDTEHTLGAAQTDDEVYVGRVNVTNMASGDVLRVRSYVKVVSAGSLALWQDETLSGVQTEKVFDLNPVGSVHSFEFRIEQTDGTGRSYEWSILKVV
jgi:hypothetical protein